MTINVNMSSSQSTSPHLKPICPATLNSDSRLDKTTQAANMAPKAFNEVAETADKTLEMLNMIIETVNKTFEKGNLTAETANKISEIANGTYEAVDEISTAQSLLQHTKSPSLIRNLLSFWISPPKSEMKSTNAACFPQLREEDLVTVEERVTFSACLARRTPSQSISWRRNEKFR